MSRTHTDLSIVIPAYNRSNRIINSLAGLFESDCAGLGAIEVVIVDDGSPEPVEAAIRTLMPPPEPFDVRIVETVNRGVGAARNRGYLESSNDLVLFLDDDVIVQRDTLQKLVRAHTEEDCGVIFGIYPFVSHESTSLRDFAASLYDYDLISSEPGYSYVSAIVSGLLTVRKSRLGDMGRIYRDDLRTPAAEEHELIYRFAREGRKIAHATHISAIHNHHLTLDWLVAQQYKYGSATAEAFAKYPQICEMQSFGDLKAILDSGGVRGSLKNLAASMVGRKILLLFARLVQKMSPKDNHNRIYGLVTAAYVRGGYRDYKFASGSGILTEAR